MKKKKIVASSKMTSERIGLPVKAPGSRKKYTALSKREEKR